MPSAAGEPSFLPAILARYHDDGPRLIYADFLDESDDPADRGRAELIRVQCALAKLTDDHARRPPLLQIQAELLHQFQDRWSEHLRGLADGFEFRRGLLDAVSLDAATFLDRGDELFRLTPVRRVRLRDANRYVAELADCPHLNRVRELDLTACDLGNGGVAVLLRSSYLGRVETLDLSFNGLCDAGVGELAKATSLSRLRSLALTDNGRIGADGVRQLAGSPYLAGLRSLDVSGNDIDDTGVRAVVESPHLTRLHAFKLYANPIGDAGAEALAGSDLLVRMLIFNPRLDLRQNRIGAAGAVALTGSDRLRRATTLDLSDNDLGDDGMSAVAGCPHLTRLRRLDLRRNRVSDAGACVFARSPLMGQLDRLDLSGNQLTRRGADALWGSRKDWRAVVELGGNFLSDDDTATPETRTERRT